MDYCGGGGSKRYVAPPPPPNLKLFIIFLAYVLRWLSFYHNSQTRTNRHCNISDFILTAPEMKIYVTEFAKSEDPVETSHNELPHLDLHCVPSSL